MSAVSVPPPWVETAAELMVSAAAQGWRITAFRLDEQEREQLRNFTCQDSTMFGRPVKPR